MADKHKMRCTVRYDGETATATGSAVNSALVAASSTTTKALGKIGVDSYDEDIDFESECEPI